MMPSPSYEGFGLWGDYFSRLLEDGFVNRLKRFGFPLPLYPSYEVLTFASVGLPPTEHISLSLSFLDMPELNTHPAYPLSTLRCVPRGSSARLEAERIANPFS